MFPINFGVWVVKIGVGVRTEVCS